MLLVLLDGRFGGVDKNLMICISFINFVSVLEDFKQFEEQVKEEIGRGFVWGLVLMILSIVVVVGGLVKMIMLMGHMLKLFAFIFLFFQTHMLVFLGYHVVLGGFGWPVMIMAGWITGLEIDSIVL